MQVSFSPGSFPSFSLAACISGGACSSPAKNPIFNGAWRLAHLGVARGAFARQAAHKVLLPDISCVIHLMHFIFVISSHFPIGHVRSTKVSTSFARRSEEHTSELQ